MTIKSGIRYTCPDSKALRGDAFAYERNDCTVRAFAVAAGVPYSDAHAFVARLGRQDRRGLRFTADKFTTVIESQLAYGYVVTRVSLRRGETVARTMLHMQTGRYLVIKTGHAFGVVDGVIHDSPVVSGARGRVLAAFKFTPSSEMPADWQWAVHRSVSEARVTQQRAEEDKQ